MKTGKNIDINPVTAEIDQILIIDDRDVLRFARVDENIKLHCQASSYGHVFANIVDQIIRKEKDILDQIQQLSTLNSDRHSEVSRRSRNVLDFFTGKSTGDHIFLYTIQVIQISKPG